VSELLAIGVSHKTAPVEVRERLALTEDDAQAFVRDVHGVADVQEVVAISTCNRTELYLVVDDPVEAESTVLGMLSRHANTRPTALAGAIYSHHNCEAARHLYRVASGLDSMIVGEDQIQGQVKRSFEAAQQRETVGPLTSHLFRAALVTGKRVRTETAISEGHLSAPSAAAMLIGEALGDLAGKRVLIIGTGETGQLAANPISDAGAQIVFMASRRRERAEALASEFGGTSAPIGALHEVLAEVDVVISATASEHVLIEAEQLHAVVSRRNARPLLLVDLAVPRDIDPACARVPGVSLFDIDDLQAVVSRARKVREGEAVKAEGIVEEEIQAFATWLGSLEVLPTIAALRSSAQVIADQVVAENDGKWESLSEQDRARLATLSRAIVNRLLHQPTVQMKEMRDDRVHARMALVRDLFGLSVDDHRAIDAAAAGAADLAEIRSLPEPRSEPIRSVVKPRGGALMRVGTRASELALIQARYVLRRLEEQMVPAEIVEISTTGDRGEAFSDKARWTSELELALLDGRIDMAVHSCKDVPGILADGTLLAAITTREDPRDVICGAASLDDLPAGARVGTVSLRRGAQVKALRPDLEIVEMRGNVDTRLRKLAAGEADAIVIAYAGLARLGRIDEIGGVLDQLVPAPGQGALAVQVGMLDSGVFESVQKLTDPTADMCIRAEREVGLVLGASCHTPVGVYGVPGPDPGSVDLRAWVGLPDGSEWVADRLTGPWATVGGQLADRMIASGARELLDRAERMAV
jgi:glutamyl-tRNA reductase